MKDMSVGKVMLTQVKWTDLFDNETDLIEAMMKCEANEERLPYKRVQGYGYIGNFQKYYRRNGKLTDKQMTQLKRLAKAIWLHLRKADHAGLSYTSE